MPFREKLILRITLVLGLRPGELFALRWDDVMGYALRLDEETIDGRLFTKLKTKGSKGFVAFPASLRVGLAEWRAVFKQTSDRQFIFHNANGGVFRLDNNRATYSNRRWRKSRQRPASQAWTFVLVAAPAALI